MELPKKMTELLTYLSYIQSGLIFYSLRYWFLQEKKMATKDLLTYSVLFSFFIMTFLGGVLKYIGKFFDWIGDYIPYSRLYDFFTRGVHSMTNQTVPPFLLGIIAFIVWFLIDRKYGRLRTNDICIWRSLKTSAMDEDVELLVKRPSNPTRVQKIIAVVDKNTKIDYLNKMVEITILKEEVIIAGQPGNTTNTNRTDILHYRKVLKMEDVIRIDYLEKREEGS